MRLLLAIGVASGIGVSALPAAHAQTGKVKLQADPITDGSVLLVSLGSAGVLQQIISTGEIRPQQISRDFDYRKLVWIDRAVVEQTNDPRAGDISNVGIGMAGAFALIDPVLSGFREGSVQAGVVDAICYAESLALTTALTNLVKMAVRRPRPIAYQEAEKHRDDPTWSNSSTDSALSFFSGHTSATAAIGATATYLAFARGAGTARPWVTLSLATAVTTLVGVERVRAGKHFPTDVIAGAFAGIGVGVLVPHLHRADEPEARRVWVGFTPAREREGLDGGVLTVGGLF